MSFVLVRTGTKIGNVSTEKSLFLQKLESQVRKPLKSLGSSCDLQPFPFMHLHHFIFGSDALSLFISKLSSELSHLTMCIFLEDLKKEEISPFLWCLLYDLY